MDMLPQVNPTNLLRPHPFKLLNPLGVHPGLTEPVEGNEGLHPVKRFREIQGDENPSLSKGLFKRKESGRGPPTRNPAMGESGSMLQDPIPSTLTRGNDRGEKPRKHTLDTDRSHIAGFDMAVMVHLRDHRHANVAPGNGILVSFGPPFPENEKDGPSSSWQMVHFGRTPAIRAGSTLSRSGRMKELFRRDPPVSFDGRSVSAEVKGRIM